MANKRDVAKTVKSLNVLLTSLRDQQVTVTLRNDSIVKGTIMSVDGDMNLELRDATVKQDPFYITTSTSSSSNETTRASPAKGSSCDADVAAGGETTRAGSEDRPSDSESSVNSAEEGDDSTPYGYFIVKGSRVRHIDLPAGLDLVNSARCELERIRNRRKQWSKRDIVAD